MDRPADPQTRARARSMTVSERLAAGFSISRFASRFQGAARRSASSAQSMSSRLWRGGRELRQCLGQPRQVGRFRVRDQVDDVRTLLTALALYRTTRMIGTADEACALVDRAIAAGDADISPEGFTGRWDGRPQRSPLQGGSIPPNEPSGDCLPMRGPGACRPRSTSSRCGWRNRARRTDPSELRTARLAAEGRTNREIAQMLWVSTKTVETHLGRIYRKLSIGSRRELTTALEASVADGSA